MALFDGNLKQRLIGTIVLIILAVVFLPMILNNKGQKLPETIVTVPAEPTRPTSPPAQAQPNIITTIPDNTQTPNTETVTPVPQQTAPTTVPNTTTTPPTQTTTTPDQPIKTDTTTPSATTTSQKPAITPNKITPTWIVQVAAVSNPQNAEGFVKKLRNANYNASSRKEGNLYRIIVGPFNQKPEAFRVQKLIEKQFKEKGIVKEFKPEAE